MVRSFFGLLGRRNGERLAHGAKGLAMLGSRTTSIVATGLFVLSLRLATADGQLALDTQGLAPGYHRDAAACVTVDSMSVPSPSSPDDPAVQQMYDGNAAAFAAVRSAFAESRHDLLNAVRLRKRELVLAQDDEVQKDAAIRLPLSVDLARLGDFGSARPLWRLMLTRSRESSMLSDRAASSDRSALQALRIAESTINPEFEDSGAAAHLQRGISSANIGDYERARSEWILAVRCSPGFPLPHLLLGISDRIQGRPQSAVSQWLSVLDGWEPQPPGPAYISQVKFEALRLLLQ